MSFNEEKHHFAAILINRLIAVLEIERPSMADALKRQLRETISNGSSISLQAAEGLVTHYYKHVSGLYLRIYEGVNLRDFGLYGYAIASSATVRSGLMLSQQFLSMTTTYYQESLHEQADSLSIIPDIDHQHPSPQILSEDFAAGYWVLLKHVITGDRSDMDQLIFEFCYPAPGYVALYEKLFAGCTLRFNQPRTLVKIPNKWLAEPISLEPSKTEVLLSEKVTVGIEQQPRQLSAIERSITDIVFRSHFTKTTMPDIADEFSMSSRQLRYYLQKSKVSVRELVLRTRMSVASRMLIETNLDIGTIAETLNYSESSALIRSFHSFYAISPLQYRMQQRDPFLSH
jgi:AraC-like DNA-binding protein